MTGYVIILRAYLNTYKVNEEPLGSPCWQQNIPILYELLPYISLPNLVTVEVSYIT